MTIHELLPIFSTLKFLTFFKYNNYAKAFSSQIYISPIRKEEAKKYFHFKHPANRSSWNLFTDIFKEKWSATISF